MADPNADEIWEAVYRAFDRWGQRSIESLFGELRKGGSVVREAYRRKWLEEAFLERRAKNAGLMRYSLTKTLKSGVLMKHKQVLLRSALVSIAAKESPVVKEFAETSRKISERPDQRPPSESYTTRSILRLRKGGYPEVFFNQGPSRRDKRTERVSTIFGTSSLPLTENSDGAAAYLAADRAKVWSDPRKQALIAHHANIRDALPEYIEAFREFRNDLEQAIGQILGDPNISRATSILLHKEAKDHPELVHVLFNHIYSILAARWFRGRSQSEKKALLERDIPLNYTKQDGLKAYEFLAADLDPPTALFFLTNMVSPAMYALRWSIDGIHMWEAVLEVRPNDPAAQAAAWDNIGIFWRQVDDPMKTIEAMNNAIPIYRRLGDESHELIADRNIGEALLRLGRTEEGLARFRSVQTRIEELTNPEERCRIWVNLAEGARRCGQTEMERDYLMRLIQENPETEVLICAENRLLLLNLRARGSQGA